MKKILTLIFLLASVIVNAQTVTWFRFDNKDYYPTDTIRLMFQISGNYNNNTPIVFTMNTGPQLSNTITKNVSLGSLNTTTYQVYTMYYYDWVIPCGAPTASNTELFMSYYNHNALYVVINPTDAAHPCKVTQPVTPPVQTAILLPFESLNECTFKVYDVTGVLLKDFYGLYKDLNLSAGFYIIKANDTGYKVRVQ
jgi:hypothetical protein